MAQVADVPEAALALLRDPDQSLTYAALSAQTGVPVSTLWHRKPGRVSRRGAAAKKQYLTPSEENALVA